MQLMRAFDYTYDKYPFTMLTYTSSTLLLVSLLCRMKIRFRRAFCHNENGVTDDPTVPVLGAMIQFITPKIMNNPTNIDFDGLVLVYAIATR